MAQTVKEMVGSSSEIILQELPGDDPKQRQPNIDLAKSVLNWEPTIELEQGLVKTIDYFRKVVGS